MAGGRATRDRGKRPLWTCPGCGHAFATRNTWHACARVSLDECFARRKPEVRAIFDAWAAYVRRLAGNPDDFRVIAQKTRIIFMTRVRFAGALLRTDGVVARFWLKRRIEHPLIRVHEFVPPSNYIYHLRLTDARQLRTRGLAAMVREACAVGRQEHATRATKPTRAS